MKVIKTDEQNKKGTTSTHKVGAAYRKSARGRDHATGNCAVSSSIEPYHPPKPPKSK